MWVLVTLAYASSFPPDSSTAGATWFLLVAHPALLGTFCGCDTSGTLLVRFLSSGTRDATTTSGPCRNLARRTTLTTGTTCTKGSRGTGARRIVSL